MRCWQRHKRDSPPRRHLTPYILNLKWFPFFQIKLKMQEEKVPPIDIGSVYDELQEYADSLWDISQSDTVDSATAAKADSMYNNVENVYLEPIRRKMYQMDSPALANATKQLNATTTDLNKTIQSIANVIQTTNDLDQYAKILDGVISAAAKTLAAV